MEFFGILFAILGIFIIIGWVSCPFVASSIASSYQKSGWGFIYGLAFGPFGIIIALLYRLNVSADDDFKREIVKGDLERRS